MEKNDHPYPIEPAQKKLREEPKEKEQEYNENYL